MDATNCTYESHESLKADGWETLPSIGLQLTDELPLELRNCDRCHTTLARPVLATAKAIADVVSRDCRPALHFTMPEGDVTALRGEFEERYALSTQIADAWDSEHNCKVQRLVVATTEDAVLTEANALEEQAEEADQEYDDWRRSHRHSRSMEAL